jgi:Ion channel
MPSKLRPLRFGFIYLTLVPLFALGYWLLPSQSLHDSNVIFEGSLAHDADALVNGMTSAVKDRVAIGANWRAAGGIFEIRRDSVRVSKIDAPKQGRITVGLEGEYIGDRRGRIGLGHFDVPVEVTLESQLVRQQVGQVAQVGYPAELGAAWRSAGAQYTGPPLSTLLPPPPESLPLPPAESGILMMPQGLYSRFAAFVNAAEGDPYYSSGRFGRMLYLSATTITTLGIGDISPVSGTARLLMGLEALLGIVAIGLLLNDLAKLARGSVMVPGSH